jgi:trimeric autotransporter adhesin
MQQQQHFNRLVVTSTHRIAATNTAVGYQSLYSNTTASYNTAVGKTALYSNTTGNLNVAVGREAMYGNTTGVHNTSVGHDNMYGNSTGSYNTSLGSWALQANTTASYQAFSNTTAPITVGYTAAAHCIVGRIRLLVVLSYKYNCTENTAIEHYYNTTGYQLRGTIQHHHWYWV